VGLTLAIGLVIENAAYRQDWVTEPVSFLTLYLLARFIFNNQNEYL